MPAPHAPPLAGVVWRAATSIITFGGRAGGPRESQETVQPVPPLVEEGGGIMSPDEPVLQTLTLPLLPIKNTVLFPYVLMPFSVGRPMSMAAVEAALATEEKEIIVVTQRDATIEEPTQDDLHTIGTKAVIKKMSRQGEYLELIVHGSERVAVLRILRRNRYMQARVRPLPLPPDKSTETEALRREVIELATRVHKLARPESRDDFENFLTNAEDPIRLAYLLGSIGGLELEREQSLLEAPSASEALRLVLAHLRTRCRCWSCATRSPPRPRRDGQGAARVLPAPAAARHPAGTGREGPRQGRRPTSCASGSKDRRPARGGRKEAETRAVAPGADARRLARAPASSAPTSS